jgi:hypothetical protein
MQFRSDVLYNGFLSPTKLMALLRFATIGAVLRLEFTKVERFMFGVNFQEHFVNESVCGKLFLFV